MGKPKIAGQLIAVGAAIFNDDCELLLGKRSSKDRFLPGNWEIFGGKTDLGESLTKALVREVAEEAGLRVKVNSPYFIYDFIYEKPGSFFQMVEIDFHCQIVGNAAVKLSHEHQDFAWAKGEDLKKFKMSRQMKKSVLEAFRTKP